MIIALTTEFGVTAFAFCVLTLFALVLFVRLFQSPRAHANLVDEAFSGIDVQLKRRHELIPNLVECVKVRTLNVLLKEVVSARCQTTADDIESQR